MATMAELKARAAAGGKAIPPVPKVSAASVASEVSKVEGAKAGIAANLDAAKARNTEGSGAVTDDVVHTSGTPVAMAGHYPQDVTAIPSIDEINERGRL